MIGIESIRFTGLQYVGPAYGRIRRPFAFVACAAFSIFDVPTNIDRELCE